MSDDGIIHDYTDTIVCPYCGYKVRDSHDVSGNNEDGDYECDECGKTFLWSRYIEVTYCTEPAKE